jgi:hypothetical protein
MPRNGQHSTDRRFGEALHFQRVYKPNIFELRKMKKRLRRKSLREFRNLLKTNYCKLMLFLNWKTKASILRGFTNPLRVVFRIRKSALRVFTIIGKRLALQSKMR